jgi:peptidyl-prolyl cis-trans isomerase B (cyclophilin B)
MRPVIFGWKKLTLNFATNPHRSMQIQRLILVGLLFTTLALSSCETPKASNTSTSPVASIKADAAPTASYEAVAAPAVAAEKGANQQFSNLPRLQGKAIVVMMVKGKPITIEVDGNNAPITAGNFVDLVQKGFYNNLTFHRVEPAFVVQGGDPQGNGTGGYIPKGQTQERRIPLEIKIKGSPAPTYGQGFEPSQIVAQPPMLTHKRGVIAMARSQMPDSASSQFYVTLTQKDFLDGQYAVFGKVLTGMEVIDSIKIGDKITSAKVTKGLEGLKVPKA